MENEPRISVVVPTFNQSQYLAECIESVLTQTYKPHEVILVNDGSQDETRYIAQQYEIKYIEQVNKGLASARNTGIMNMAGDWFMPLDSDDKMAPNCLERIAQEIEKTDADIIAPSFKTFGKYDSPVILGANPTLEDFKPINFQPQNRIGYFSAIKKEVLLEIGGYSPRMTWGYEDYHLWINLLARGRKIVTIPEVLIFYRTKENSMITEAQAHNNELVAQIHKDFPLIK